MDTTEIKFGEDTKLSVARVLVFVLLALESVMGKDKLSRDTE